MSPVFLKNGEQVKVNGKILIMLLPGDTSFISCFFLQIMFIVPQLGAYGMALLTRLPE